MRGGSSQEPGHRTLESFTNRHLPDDIVMTVDRAAMTNSLESRAVFLDNDLVELCPRLLAHFKCRNGSANASFAAP